MKHLNFKYLNLFLVVLLVAGSLALAVGFGGSSSSNYKITLYALSSGSSQAASSSYKLHSIARSRALTTLTSSSYILWQGFLRSAFLSISQPGGEPGQPGQGGQPSLNPVVTSITPAESTNSGLVSITALAGANFQAGASVKLSRSGQTDITAASVQVVSSSLITCTFDLSGAAVGLWDLTVTNSDNNSGSLPSAFTVSYPAPTVLSITPDSGNNDGVVEITNIAGTNFRSGAAVKLSKAGESDITASDVAVSSSSSLACRFDLTDKSIGLWNVVVTNDDDQSASLPLGFKIEAPSIRVVGTIVSTKNPFNPLQGATTLKYTLTKDADITLYIYNLRGERVWQRFYPAGSPGGSVGVNEIVWDGLTDFKRTVSFGVYILDVMGKDNGQPKLLSRTKIAVVK